MARGNRKSNDLFIGEDFLTTEGRTIKHPSLIKFYANLNVNKTRDVMLSVIGIDIETNHLTGEMRLLGFYEGADDEESKEKYLGQYRHYTKQDGLLGSLIANVKYAITERKHFAYWNSLDCYQIFRLFLLHNHTKEKEE